jgi:hypothetical protein
MATSGPDRRVTADGADRLNVVWIFTFHEAAHGFAALRFGDLDLSAPRDPHSRSRARVVRKPGRQVI